MIVNGAGLKVQCWLPYLGAGRINQNHKVICRYIRQSWREINRRAAVEAPGFRPANSSAIVEAL